MKYGTVISGVTNIYTFGGNIGFFYLLLHKIYAPTSPEWPLMLQAGFVWTSLCCLSPAQENSRWLIAVTLL